MNICEHTRLSELLPPSSPWLKKFSALFQADFSLFMTISVRPYSVSAYFQFGPILFGSNEAPQWESLFITIKESKKNANFVHFKQNFFQISVHLVWQIELSAHSQKVIYLYPLACTLNAIYFHALQQKLDLQSITCAPVTLRQSNWGCARKSVLVKRAPVLAVPIIHKAHAKYALCARYPGQSGR